jgi:hypothetical protein
MVTSHNNKAARILSVEKNQSSEISGWMIKERQGVKDAILGSRQYTTDLPIQGVVN